MVLVVGWLQFIKNVYTFCHCGRRCYGGDERKTTVGAAVRTRSYSYGSDQGRTEKEAGRVALELSDHGNEGECREDETDCEHW